MNANAESRRTADSGDCRRCREWLCAPAAAAGATADTPLAAHLASCPECAVFAHRLELARQELGRPLSAIEPDPNFSARVLARIARPAEVLGWAAFRALPAALGLAFALACLGLSLPALAPASPAAPAAVAAAVPSPLLDEPPSSEQLLAWSSLSPEVWP
ncbi:MAG TPA: hypothetical protein VKY89_03605 [Thermoanaerobaculia bacterium]|jgi:hypothetical protein|nr:hypothetical protein [Thermoanaerobaculia bacterium]